MPSLRALLLFVLSCLALANAFMIDDNDAMENSFPKRSPYQYIWRNIQMQMPPSGSENMKRTASLSRAGANAYYRLG